MGGEKSQRAAQDRLAGERPVLLRAAAHAFTAAGGDHNGYGPWIGAHGPSRGCSTAFSDLA
jgi:hypothetical protein